MVEAAFLWLASLKSTPSKNDEPKFCEYPPPNPIPEIKRGVPNPARIIFTTTKKAIIIFCIIPPWGFPSLKDPSSRLLAYLSGESKVSIIL
jgi:hypothetical protein